MYEYMPLDWKTEKPTVEGWYWAVNKNGDREIVRFYGSVYVAGWEVLEDVSDWTHWLGPLLVPEPPK